MDSGFRRWVKLSTVLALVKPKRDDVVLVRFFTEDPMTKKHHPWLEKNTTFTLGGYMFDRDDGTDTARLRELAGKFVAKTITIDRLFLDRVKYPYTTDCFLIEVKENENEK